jgi:hypothetical protein
MSRLLRIAIRLGPLVVLFVGLVGLPRVVTGGDRGDTRLDLDRLSLERMIEALGPGPLPPTPLTLSNDGDRPKAATIGERQLTPHRGRRLTQ